MAFGGDVSVGASAVLKMELAGTTPGTQFDRLTVQQSLALGGTLEVTLTGGFTPAAGQSFNLLDWGSLSGTFASINLPTLAGLAWNTSQLYTSGVVSVTVGLAGDFSGNGSVDAADYTVWRDGLGTSYTMDDYTVWKSHFGQTADAGSGSAGISNFPAVPEPTGAMLAIAMTLTVLLTSLRAGRTS
jgi:hypothetical protein